MPRIIDNPGNNNFQKSKASSERDTGWVTPEIPRGFFTTTNRVQYSPQEDFSQEEDVVEDDDDVTFVWEGTHQRDDEDDDDEDEPITVLNPEYKHEFTTFGQHVRTDNDDAVEHDVAADDDYVYDDVPLLQNFQTNPPRHRHNTGLPPRPPAAPQNRAQRPPAAPKNRAPSRPAASTSTLRPPTVPRSKVNSRYKSSSLLPPRDPQLHRSAITPPCPIQPGELQTPSGERLYTHVSLCSEKNSCSPFR